MKEIEPFYIEAGKLIQAKRNENGMSQEALGKKLNPKVTRASIANIETGKQRILSHTLLQLSEALDVDITALLPAQLSQQKTKPKSSTGQVKNELIEKLALPSGDVKKLITKINANTGKDKI